MNDIPIIPIVTAEVFHEGAVGLTDVFGLGGIPCFRSLGGAPVVGSTGGGYAPTVTTVRGGRHCPRFLVFEPTVSLRYQVRPGIAHTRKDDNERFQ